MDLGTRAQGEQLIEVLQLFKQATTSPLSGSILKTHAHKVIPQEVRSIKEIANSNPHRKSPRLSAKGSKGKIVLKLAQDLIVKKCGIVPNEESLDDTTLQQYLVMYKKHVPDTSMQAILKFSKVASEKKKKKKGKVAKEKEKKRVVSAKSKMLEASRKMISKKKDLKSKGKAPVGAEA
jgi:hypothetical protein